MRRLALIAGLFLASTSCEQTTSVAPAPRPEIDPVYAIYSLVLDSLFLGTVQANRASPQFVVIEATNGGAAGESELGDFVEKQFVSHKALSTSRLLHFDRRLRYAQCSIERSLERARQ